MNEKRVAEATNKEIKIPKNNNNNQRDKEGPTKANKWNLCSMLGEQMQQSGLK